MRRTSIAGLLLTLSACAQQPQEVRPARSADITSVTVIRSAEVAPAPPKPREAFGDPQALALILALDKSFVDESTLAQTRASDAEVKKLAAAMLHDHATMLDRHLAIARKNDLAPAECERSRQIRDDAQKRLADLEQTSGAEFDERYVYDQVTGHVEALLLIDSKILPNLETHDLSRQITNDRTKLAHHLAAARELQRRLGPGVALNTETEWRQP